MIINVLNLSSMNVSMCSLLVLSTNCNLIPAQLWISFFQKFMGHILFDITSDAGRSWLDSSLSVWYIQTTIPSTSTLLLPGTWSCLAIYSPVIVTVSSWCFSMSRNVKSSEANDHTFMKHDVFLMYLAVCMGWNHSSFECSFKKHRRPHFDRHIWIESFRLLYMYRKDWIYLQSARSSNSGFVITNFTDVKKARTFLKLTGTHYFHDHGHVLVHLVFFLSYDSPTNPTNYRNVVMLLIPTHQHHDIAKLCS